jgi:nucleoside 2-deoxyribosyltransferase
MIVVGGTYDEICFEPRWQEKFGSGLRACRAINNLDPEIDIEFHTFGNDNTRLFLNQLNAVFPKIKSTITSINRPISFYYDHPLSAPKIQPRLDTIGKEKNNFEVDGGDILYFGLIEGNATIRAKRAVYDPQSPANPIPFSKTGSTAESLAVVVNFGEAKKMAEAQDVEGIKNYFFSTEGVDVLVLKIGAKGAWVIDKSGKEDLIPVYKTSSVWPIGSGDVFASSFAYYWFAGTTAKEAAEKASYNTAVYCSTKSLDFKQKTESNPLVIAHVPTGKVYLAGPFFTFAERWLIDQIRMCLVHTGLSVFSPWHDIGHGIASDVVSKDLEGLEASKLVFAVIDGLDSGTLFEVGYAVKKNIPVIAYVENETEESVKMLEGTGCILEKDLTSAIYKAYWLLAENE